MPLTDLAGRGGGGVIVGFGHHKHQSAVKTNWMGGLLCSLQRKPPSTEFGTLHSHRAAAPACSINEMVTEFLIAIYGNRTQNDTIQSACAADDLVPGQWLSRV